MNEIVEKIDFETMYLKARDGFENCIVKNEEEVDEEIGLRLKDIHTKENWIRIQFFGSDQSHYIVETNILLFHPSGEKLGYYCLHEDENGDVVDDYLVFE